MDSNNSHGPNDTAKPGPLPTEGALALDVSVEIEGDDMASYEHRSDENNRWLRLHFCQKCATTIMLTIERMPDVYLITGGTLDDPKSLEIEVHAWMRSSPPWMALPLRGDCFQTSSGAGIKQLEPNRA